MKGVGSQSQCSRGEYSKNRSSYSVYHPFAEMSEQPVIYSMTKQQANAKQPRRKPPNKPKGKDRNEQQLTYVEVKYRSPDHQGRQNSAECKDSPAPSPWRLVALILGVLCLSLLVFISISGIKLFQGPKIFNGDKVCPGNITSNQETGQNINPPGTQQPSNNEDHECRLCPRSWHQHGQKCYRVFAYLNTWQGCQNYCASQGSGLSTLKTKKELVRKNLLEIQWEAKSFLIDGSEDMWFLSSPSYSINGKSVECTEVTTSNGYEH
ncbi:NKG2-A/NKG2-B type II integral membrane protein-like [Tachyglossus aculeatus]|uniref:NKG2-A/NKG2-B type II integral membrane protein-like n=1 Tax=Tachyglossus aculeatus TaxID=9261 RepID=UPI0018F41099|nr:NKG2-A/NKG2-B type II integral membrane protein-like [Tachyglossus aculeatus]